MTTARLLISADSELGNAIRDLQRVNTELGETARAAQRAASDVGGAGNGMLGSLRRVAEFAAGGLLTGGITALVGAFGQAASAGMEFGTTINRIQALAGATAGEMGAVEAKALELGAALPLSASQAAEGIQELVAGGMSLNDALAAATGTAQLAASQLMPVGDAASIVSAALNSFGLAAGEAGRVSDVLSMAANKSASSVPELGEALKYVGGVAGSLSQPLEGTAAAIGLMANAGIQGSMAGTALRATLTELATPSKATASALEQMGVATVNSAGQMRPFMDIAADMRQAMDGMSDSQKTMIANTIAGTPGMAGFLAVLNASPDSFNEMRAAMDGATGATAAFGQATGQGAAFALEQLKGSIETVLVQGFRAVEPALVGVLSVVTNVVNGIGSAFASAAPQIKAAAGFISDAFKELGEGDVTGAIGQILMALGLAEDKALEVAEGIAGAMKPLADRVREIAPIVQGVLAGAFQAFGQIAQSVLAALPGLASIVMGVLQQVAGVVSNVLAMAFALLAPLAQSVFQGIVTIVQMALPPFMTLAQSVGGLVVAAFQTLHQIAVAVFTAIQPHIPVLQQAITYLATVIGAMLANTFLALSNIINTIVIPAIQAAGNWFAQNLPGLINVAMSFITGTVIPIFMRLVSWLADAIPGALNALAGFWQTHGDQIVGIAQTAWNLIQSAVQTVLGVVAQLWSAWNSAREGDWRGFGEKLRKLWDGAWNAIVSVVTTVGPRVLKAITTLLGQARDAFTSIDWGELGRNIITGVAQGISRAAGRVADAARQAAQNALDAAKGFLGIQSPSRVMADEVGRPVAEGLAAGILAGGPVAIDAMLSLAAGVASVARQLVNTVQGYGKGLGNELDRLGDLADGIERVASILSNVADAAKRLSDIAKAGGLAANTGLAGSVAALARGLVDAMQGSGKGLGNEIGRLEDLAHSIQAVASIADSVKQALATFKALGAVDLGGLDALTALFGRLAGWAADLARAGGQAAGIIAGPLVAALETLATATGAASDVAGRSLQLARLLVEALAFDWGATNWGQARDMLVGLVDLAEFLVNAAGAAATQTKFAVAGLDALKTALELTAGVVSSVLQLAALLVQALAFDWGSTDWGVARDMLVGLVDLGEFLVLHADIAALTFQGVGGNLAELQTALDPLAGIITSVMDTARGLVAALQYNWGGTNWGTARDMLVGLVDLAEFLVYHADVAASTYEDVGPELANLGGALDTVLGIADGVMGLATRLIAALAFNWGATNWGTARDMLVGLVDLGEFLVYHANMAASTFAGAGPELALLAASIQDTLGLLTHALDLAKLITTRLSGAAVVLPNAAAMIERLTTWAIEMGRTAAVTAASFDTAADGLSNLAGAVSDLLGLVEDTVGLLVFIAQKLSQPLVLPNAAAMLQRLVQWALEVGSAANAAAAPFAEVVTDGLSNLTGAVSDLLGLAGDTFDLIALTAERMAAGPLALPNEAATGALFSRLVVWAQAVLAGAIAAAAGFETAKDYGLGTLASVLSDFVGFFDDSLELVRSVAEALKAGPMPLPNEAAASALFTRLVMWARVVLAGAISAAAGFALAKDYGLGQLGTALSDFVGFFDDTLGLIKSTAEVLKNGLALPNEGAASTLFSRLVVWARAVLAGAISAAAGFALAKDYGLGQLGTALSDFVGFFDDTLGLIKSTAEVLKNGLALPNEGAASTLFSRLVVWARAVLAGAISAAAGFALAKDYGLGQLGTAAGDFAGLLDDTLGLVKTATALIKTPPVLPDASATSALFGRLVVWARAVSAGAIEAAAGFALAKDYGLGQLATAAGDVVGLIETGLGLDKLEGALAAFDGFDVAGLQPKLTLLVHNLIAIARQFGQAAEGAGITEAWTEAGQKLAGLVGDAIGSMKDTLDFALRLADSELRIPSAAQIAGKLRAVLVILRDAVTAFANEADSIQIDQDAAARLAATVTPITEALGGLIELVQSFNGLNLGMSGYNNLRSFMSMIFDTFTDFAPDAGQVQAVVNALTSALSGLGNLMQSLGAQHGQSYASAFVAAVQAGLAQGLAPSAPGATPAPLPPAPGQGGGTVVNNYFTLNQYGVGAATAGAAAASFMGMKATIGAAP